MVDARKRSTGEMQTKPTKPTAAIVLSVNTFLKRKQKAYIYHIYFEIATFLKTGV